MQQLVELFRDTKVSGEATEALKHFSCDACDGLKQPPARRQVAIAHAQTFNDVVSLGVNVWKLMEQNIRETKAVAVPSVVDAARAMHIASKIPNQESNMMWKTFRA